MAKGKEPLIEILKKEIQLCQNHIEHCEEIRESIRHDIESYDEYKDLFDEIIKYKHYKKAFEQAVNGFPFETGSY